MRLLLLVGQTKRKIKTQIKEHKVKKIKRFPDYFITDRMWPQNKWDNVQMLEPCFHKRIMSKMMFIKKQIDDLNMQSATEKLSETYFPVLNITSLT